MSSVHVNFLRSSSIFSREVGVDPLSPLAIRLQLSWTSIAVQWCRLHIDRAFAMKEFHAFVTRPPCVCARERQMSLQSQASSIALTDCCRPACVNVDPHRRIYLLTLDLVGKLAVQYVDDEQSLRTTDLTWNSKQRSTYLSLSKRTAD